MANAAPTEANRIWAQASPVPENADHSATIESAPPATGVHRPAQSNSPDAISAAILNDNIGSEANPVIA